MAAAASDKARFYLEQSVPELQAFKEKGIFSASEITSIASKRSSFEHRINMPGASTPIDFARYASYELNLDTLRKKRCKRLGVKGTSFAGQKRVFSVLERGLRKFPGDMGLWMQYLEYCKDENANSKLAKGITKVLRLNPRRWELWVWAARYYFEVQGDMALARSYMQRGLRFCEREQEMWVQFLRLEMIYVAKVNARRKILKLDEEAEDVLDDEEPGFGDKDEISLPKITAGDMESDTAGQALAIDDATIRHLSKSPALSGAIPMAIVDAAAKAFKSNPTVLEDLFNCVAAFDDVPCTREILQQIIDLMPATSREPHAEFIRVACEGRLAMVGVNATSPLFIPAFQGLLGKFASIPMETPQTKVFTSTRMLITIIPYIDNKDALVEEVFALLDTIAHRNAEQMRLALGQVDSKANAKQVERLADRLIQQGIKKHTLRRYGLAQARDG
ncbi:hypothetical protein CAC42_6929 [Sphaceloma murrayae]|uniref:U3 small nucleolar RNA-associated protein 6 N-terminal domain-containing protein n=1 Tax=Sphaceloma murrayae TaxID=2082308 RepID=A0A2K1QQ74_9PEZI|nr:hypothetical protein CAC42_6929 [Sphaceloma murrayae]